MGALNHTFHYLFLGYLILYGIYGLGLLVLYAVVVPQEDKKTDQPWETPLDIALAVAGMAGMLFLFMDVQAHWLHMTWRAVSILLLVTQVWGNVKARLKFKVASDEKRMVALADLATFLFLAPSLALNLYYAFR